jgi:hypothetical protein
MRRILYRVASSLDGYIEGPRGEIDWIPFLGAGAAQTRLKLTHSQTHPSGIVRLHYDIRHSVD